ncbi:MAG: DNA-3-methyladenine glycosidase [Flavobacteriaceae bacterium]|nr:MAG: DNA-3-methyladenine glycosidase [Flavobacteriaceae bacterium]
MIKLINNEAFINYAFNQLSKDPVMESLINSLGHKINPTERYNRNYALAICNLIIEQQISFKAAITIKNKFKELITGLSNSDIIKLDNNKVQSIGLSFRKVEYMKNVLIFFEKNNYEFENFTNDEVFEKLISIKGVGKWTCEMFLIFVLFRPDIFSFGDIALINSIKKNYNVNSRTEIEKIVNNYKPYRSIASLILWASVESDTFFKKSIS